MQIGSEGGNSVNDPKLYEAIFLLLLDGELIWCSVVRMAAELIEGARIGEYIAAKEGHCDTRQTQSWLLKIVGSRQGPPQTSAKCCLVLHLRISETFPPGFRAKFCLVLHLRMSETLPPVKF